MLDFVFKKNLWLLDLMASLVFGVWAGYSLQLTADSGEQYPDKLAVAAIIGGSSYIFAFLFSLLLRQRFSSVPSWVWLGFGGSLIFALGKAAFTFAFNSWNPELLVPSALFNFIFLVLPLLFFLIFLRVLLYLLRKILG